jgi:hypothetical protein
VVAWIVIPPDPDEGTEPARRETGPLVGLILLGVGVLWLGGRLVPNGDLAELIWPLTLIGGGIAVLVMRAGSPDDPTHADAAPADAPDATAYPVGAARADTGDAEATTSTDAPEEPDAATTSAWAQPARWPSAPRPARPPRPPRAPKPLRPRSYLGALTVSVVALFAGITALLATLDVLDVDVEVAGAIALGIVGVALIVSAWFGRARGLVPLAVLLSLALGVVAVIDTPIAGGIGDRDYRPASLAQLDDEYRLAIGSMTLDLRAVPLRAGITEVEASVAIGQLEVLVPPDVTVEVHAETGVGRVALFGVADGGISVERDDTARASGARVLRLDLRTGIGETTVDRAPAQPPAPSEPGVLR